MNTTRRALIGRAAGLGAAAAFPDALLAQTSTPTKAARRFDPDFDASTIELRDSRAGNYLGVTITVTATSREQLDDLYRALTSHPMVKVVL